MEAVFCPLLKCNPTVSVLIGFMLALLYDFNNDFFCTSDLTLKKNVGIQTKNNCLETGLLINNSASYLFTEK